MLRHELVGFGALLLAAGVTIACRDDETVSQEHGSHAPDIQQGTLITLADGQIQGAVDGGSRRFLGIPFAKPPVGELRWKAPVKNDPWTGVRDTTAFGGRCAQLANLQAPESLNEDCLYLNVWVPEPAPTTLVPVMFWIHGGGNTSGSASDDIPLGVGNLFYNGRAFAERHGVIVVTTNYRVGALGFFSHPDLAKEGSPAGNQGLLDQRRALEWVHDNIAAFGGDPSNVTVFGESAGSFDTCFHVVSPGSKGLFQRAISESGGCTTRILPLAEANTGVAPFVEAMGCTHAADPLACLRDKPVADLIVAPPIDGAPDPQLPGGAQYVGLPARWRFGPVVDGEVLPDQPRALFADGNVADVPYILGSNTDEGTLFHISAPPVTTEAEYMAALERRFKTLAPEVAKLYPVANFDSPNAAIQRVTGDASLVCGTFDSAVRAAEAGRKVWMYNFDFPIAIQGLDALGATHGAEIAFVFASAADPTADQAKVSEIMQDYWVRFAKTGDPNGDTAFAWPSFGPSANKRLNIRPDPSVVEDFRKTECAFWRQTYDAAFQ